MPRGTQYSLTGLLVADLRGGFALEIDGGGRWQLDLHSDRKARGLLDQRVAVTGRRGGFDILEVEMIIREGRWHRS